MRMITLNFALLIFWCWINQTTVGQHNNIAGLGVTSSHAVAAAAVGTNHNNGHRFSALLQHSSSSGSSTIIANLNSNNKSSSSGAIITRRSDRDHDPDDVISGLDPSVTAGFSLLPTSAKSYFKCPEKFGYYPDPNDCTQYFVCVFGEPLHETCTGGLYFSAELQTCDWPRNVLCANKAQNIPNVHSSAISVFDEVDDTLSDGGPDQVDQVARDIASTSRPPASPSAKTQDASSFDYDLIGDKFKHAEGRRNTTQSSSGQYRTPTSPTTDWNNDYGSSTRRKDPSSKQPPQYTTSYSALVRPINHSYPSSFSSSSSSSSSVPSSLNDLARNLGGFNVKFVDNNFPTFNYDQSTTPPSSSGHPFNTAKASRNHLKPSNPKSSPQSFPTPYEPPVTSNYPQSTDTVKPINVNGPHHNKIVIDTEIQAPSFEAEAIPPLVDSKGGIHFSDGPGGSYGLSQQVPGILSNENPDTKVSLFFLKPMTIGISQKDHEKLTSGRSRFTQLTHHLQNNNNPRQNNNPIIQNYREEKSLNKMFLTTGGHSQQPQSPSSSPSLTDRYIPVIPISPETVWNHGNTRHPFDFLEKVTHHSHHSPLDRSSPHDRRQDHDDPDDQPNDRQVDRHEPTRIIDSNKHDNYNDRTHEVNSPHQPPHTSQSVGVNSNQYNNGRTSAASSSFDTNTNNRKSEIRSRLTPSASPSSSSTLSRNVNWLQIPSSFSRNSHYPDITPVTPPPPKQGPPTPPQFVNLPEETPMNSSSNAYYDVGEGNRLGIKPNPNAHVVMIPVKVPAGSRTGIGRIRVLPKVMAKAMTESQPTPDDSFGVIFDDDSSYEDNDDRLLQHVPPPQVTTSAPASSTSKYSSGHKEYHEAMMNKRRNEMSRDSIVRNAPSFNPTSTSAAPKKNEDTGDFREYKPYHHDRNRDHRDQVNLNKSNKSMETGVIYDVVNSRPKVIDTSTSHPSSPSGHHHLHDTSNHNVNPISKPVKVINKKKQPITYVSTPRPSISISQSSSSSSHLPPSTSYSSSSSPSTTQRSPTPTIATTFPTTSTTTSTTPRPVAVSPTVPAHRLQAAFKKSRPTNKRLVIKERITAPAKLPSRPKAVYPTPQPYSTASKCDPKMCRVPDCNCGSSSIPGGGSIRSSESVPQMIMITFDDAINDLNFEIYEEIFNSGRKNPNGCPLLGTFYVSHEWTDYGQVQSLYSKGHEMASHGIT